MSKSEKAKSATERLSDIENALMSMFNTLDTMARDLMSLKDATSVVNNKADSIIAAAQAGESINNDSVRKYMVANNVQGLKEKVDSMAAQGFLAAEETATENSFVVGQEIDSNGEVANPRIQFVVSSVGDEAVRSKVIGSKAGDLLDFAEGKLKLKILETYRLTQTDAAQTAPTAESTADATPTLEATPAPEAEAAFAATSTPSDAETVEATQTTTAAS